MLHDYPWTPSELEQWRFLLQYPFSVQEATLSDSLRLSLSQRHIPDHRWFAATFGWWAARTSRSSPVDCSTVVPQAPPAMWCPFPIGARKPSDRGRLAFVTAQQDRDYDSASLPRESSEQAVLHALSKQSSLSPRECRFVLPKQQGGTTVPFEGSSYALASLIAMLSDALDLQIPDDVAATGGWDGKHLVGVEDGVTWVSKLNVLREWGYKRLFVVSGQGARAPGTDGIALVSVPGDPLRAAEAIVRDLWGDSGSKIYGMHQDQRRGAARPAWWVDRTAIQSEFDKWLNDPRRPTVFWLHGILGIGKSSLLARFEEILQTNGRYACRFAGAGDETVEAFLTTAARTVAECYSLTLPRIPRDRDEISEVIREMSERADTCDAAIPPPVLLLDGIDDCDGDVKDALLSLSRSLDGQRIAVVIASEQLPPADLQAVCKRQLKEMSLDETRRMVEGALGSERALKLAGECFPQSRGSEALALFAERLHQRTKGLSIFLGVLCDLMQGQQPGMGWMPEGEESFAAFAKRHIAVRASTVGESGGPARHVLSVLLAASGPIPEDAIIGATRVQFSRHADVDILVSDVLNRVRFAVHSWRQDRQHLFRVSHRAYADALRSTLTANELHEGTVSLAEWCASESTTGDSYALRNGPRHLLAAIKNGGSDRGLAQRLYDLARDPDVAEHLRADSSAGVRSVTAFLRSALTVAVNAGHVGDAVEFALRTARGVATAQEDFDLCGVDSLDEGQRLIEQELHDIGQRKLASLILALRYLKPGRRVRGSPATASHVLNASKANAVRSLLIRFFAARDQQAILSDQFRDACIPLVAGVLCACAGELQEDDLDGLGRILFRSFDRDCTTTIARAVIFQSVNIEDPDRRREVRQCVVALVDPDRVKQSDSDSRAPATSSHTGAQGRVSPTQRAESNAGGRRVFPLQPLVNAFLDIGDLPAAIRVFQQHRSVCNEDKRQWIAADLIEACARFDDPVGAQRLVEQEFPNRPITSQGLVAGAALAVAKRRDSGFDRLEATLNRIADLCVDRRVSTHVPRDLARIAYLSAAAGFTRLAHSQIASAFSLAMRLQPGLDRVRAGLEVNLQTRRIAVDTRRWFNDLAKQQLTTIDEALLGVAVDTAVIGQTDRNINALDVIRKTHSNLAKAWAHCGDLDHACHVVFRLFSRVIDTASPARGEALAEMALKALDFGEPWDWVVRRAPKHRLTVVSRVLGRLCERNDYANATDLALQQLRLTLSRDGAKAWWLSTVNEAAQVRRSLTAGSSAEVPAYTSTKPSKDMWKYLDYATLCGCSDHSRGREAATATLKAVQDRLGTQLWSIDLAVLGHELCLHGHGTEGASAFQRAVAGLLRMDTATRSDDRFRLEAEVLERLAVSSDFDLLDKVEKSFWSHAGDPSYRQNVAHCASTARGYARSTLLDPSRTERAESFITRVRRKLDLAPENPGPADMRAASAVLCAAKGKYAEAERAAWTIGRPDARASALGDVAKALLLTGQIDEVRRIASCSLQDKQVKNLVRLVLSPVMAHTNRRQLLLALLEPASRFLGAAAWCAAGLIMVDEAITVEQVEQIISAARGPQVVQPEAFATASRLRNTPLDRSLA